MEQERAGRHQNQIITIPNILSFFRLCLIPLIVWLYCVKKDYPLSTLVLLISGFTDIADGIIARRSLRHSEHRNSDGWESEK